MTPETLRRFAQRCRELSLRTRTDAARRQLTVWAEEFDAWAADLEREPASNSPAADNKP